MTTLAVIKCDACGTIIEDTLPVISLRCEPRGGYAEDISECNIYLNKDGNERLVNTTENSADFCCKACFVQYITVGL